MPKFKNDNGRVVTTDLPREIQRLKAEGFREVEAEKPVTDRPKAEKPKGPESKTTK